MFCQILLLILYRYLERIWCEGDTARVKAHVVSDDVTLRDFTKIFSVSLSGIGDAAHRSYLFHFTQRHGATGAENSPVKPASSPNMKAFTLFNLARRLIVGASD